MSVLGSGYTETIETVSCWFSGLYEYKFIHTIDTALMHSIYLQAWLEAQIPGPFLIKSSNIPTGLSGEVPRRVSGSRRYCSQPQRTEYGLSGGIFEITAK